MKEREALRRALRRNPEMAKMLKGMIDDGRLKANDPDSTEPLMIISTRWPGLMDDCRMALCTFCGSEIALAPSSQQMIDASKAESKYCCMECFNDGALERYQAEEKAKEDAAKSE